MRHLPPPARYHGPTSVRYTPAAVVHGRCIVDPARAAQAPLLVGFHGYAETDEVQIERLRLIPGAPAWTLVSVQALHRFYRGRGADRVVVASWMTRQDRELAITDNLAYVASVIRTVLNEHPSDAPPVLAGFSQGVAMAFRAAARHEEDVAGVIALGGDVPPELDSTALGRIPRVLLGRGTSDEQYSQRQWEADAARLQAAGVEVHQIGVAGGHEWTTGFSDAAGAFLACAGRPSR